MCFRFQRFPLLRHGANVPDSAFLEGMLLDEKCSPHPQGLELVKAGYGLSKRRGVIICMAENLEARKRPCANIILCSRRYIVGRCVANWIFPQLFNMWHVPRYFLGRVSSLSCVIRIWGTSRSGVDPGLLLGWDCFSVSWCSGALALLWLWGVFGAALSLLDCSGVILGLPWGCFRAAVAGRRLLRGCCSGAAFQAGLGGAMREARPTPPCKRTCIHNPFQRAHAKAHENAHANAHANVFLLFCEDKN